MSWYGGIQEQEKPELESLTNKLYFPVPEARVLSGRAVLAGC